MQTNEGHPLLVIRDFGSYPQALTPFLKEDSKKIVERTETKDLILSHAHKDHSNGFFFMHERLTKIDPAITAKPFRNAYIPALRYKDTEDLGALMLKVGLCYLYFLPSSSSKSGKITHWIKTTPILYDLSEHLIGVQQGFTFGDWEQKGTVLWPPKSDSDFYKELVLFMKETADLLLQDIPQNMMSNLLTTYEEIRSKMAQMDGNGQVSPLTQASEIVNSHLDAFLRLCHTNDTTTPAKKTLDRNRCNRYLDSIDNHSIVFSLETKDGADGILFLSDLYENAMNVMCSDWESRTYKYIKSAHHGTRLGKSFVQKVKADTIIHCCGEGHSNYHQPDCNYFNIAPCNICSDWSYNCRWKNRNKFELFNSDKHTITV